MSKLSFRARALDASKPMPIYLAEELPDLPDYSAINRAVPQMPSGMEKEEECEHHLQRAICTGLIIPTPEVCPVSDLEFYERCYPPDYKMPKQHIHMQPLWQEQEQPEYDIDTDDERWLKQQRHPELTELKFEQMMDKLERCSGQTVVTLSEAKLLLERQDDLVIAVYDYWLNKRLKTQHPLILSVKTEGRPGQSSNNPYLAFRRRTEKMQTRKNRKNDESSYEKMLKLRRDLGRALSLLELVARRERAKRELVRLTALLAERRHRARDYSATTDLPSRPSYSAASLAAAAAAARLRDGAPRRQSPLRAPPGEIPRPRQKRTYKRRKHRHHGDVGHGLRDSGVYTSSEDETSQRAETGTPPDDGPYAFRRKAGCYYEMPTTTLYGDPVDPENTSKDALYQHELDNRLRFTLTSVRGGCVGFCRRRVTRGGRVALDRRRTPLDRLWGALPFVFQHSSSYKADRDEEVQLETEQHRNPKEMTRDYHTSGKYPWRHAFRKHLARSPDLWIDRRDVSDTSASEVRTSDVKCASGSGDRKRAWSGSDSSYDSDASLEPVEEEFKKFIDEVNKKWLHFRPKTPPPTPPSPPPPPPSPPPVTPSTPLAVQLSCGPPSSSLDFTAEFTLAELYGDRLPDHDVDVDQNLGLTDAQVESILEDTDLKSIDVTLTDKKATVDLIEELASDVDSGPFLSHGQSSGQARGPKSKLRDTCLGSTVVNVTQPEREPFYIEREKQVKVEPVKLETVKIKKEESPVKVTAARATPPPLPPPPATTTRPADDIPELPAVKLESKKAAPRVSGSPRAAPRALSRPQILTVAVSDTLRVRLQNHLLSTSAAAGGGGGGVVSASGGGGVLGLNLLNGPAYEPLRRNIQRESTGPVSVSVGGSASPRLVQLTSSSVAAVPPPPSSSSSSPSSHPSLPLPPKQLHQPLLVTQPHTNKLKVLHAHPLTQSQRSQLLAQNRVLPAVVSLAARDPTAPPHLQLKAAPSVTHFYEIKGPLTKGPHLVNVVRQPQPGKTTVARLDLNDAKKRQVVAAFDGATLKGNMAAAARPHRLSVSLEGRQIVRAVPPVRHQIQLKNRTLQVAPQIRTTDPSTSITIAAPTKTASIPSSVVANLLQKNVQLPKSGQKIAISGAAGQALAANVQAIAFTTQLKARQARLIAQPRAAPVTEIVEATTSAASTSGGLAEPALEGEGGEASTNGAVRRRTADNLPMEVT